MRQEKQLLLDEVKGQMDKHGTFVIMSYQKVTANLANQFRNEIAQLGGNVEVVRKRLLVRAADGIGLKLDLEGLPGHIGLVLAGKDPIETTKAVFRFSQENDQALQVLGGRFEGQFYDGKQVEMLSSLPGKDEMRAQLLATFEAPLSQVLAVMEALLSSVVYCLDNKCKEEKSE
jgi:large subunit ribosomal protein L10